MTPNLARYIRLARNRVEGTVLSDEERADAEREEDILRFKQYLAARICIDLRLELFIERKWERNAQGCSLQFVVDDYIFLLQQSGSGCKLFQCNNEQLFSLTLLEDDDQFEDRLLIAIDNAMRSTQIN